MNRREIIINLLLLIVIGALAYFIFSSDQRTPEQLEVTATPAANDGKVPPTTETTYNPVEGNRKYPKFGEKPLFQALITPTPTPTPPPPPPTKTPDIEKALANWKLQAVDPGEATVEDKAKREDNVFSMKVGESRPVQAGDQAKNVTLVKVDDKADNPSATFGLQDTTDQKTLKMFEEGALPPQ